MTVTATGTVAATATGGRERVAVFGATGHTARFVLAELHDRGYVPIAVGRNADRLRTLARADQGWVTRVASADDPYALDRALDGAAAVVNCAGPFATTAAPLIEAALRAGIAYVDVAAEIEALTDTFARFAGRARDAGVAVVPAMAFFGGLGDLLTTAATAGWTHADEAHIAYGLSSWHPTAGTRAAGRVSRQRRAGRGVRFTGGRLEYHDDETPTLRWPFPPPLGTRSVVGGFTMADAVTVPSHLRIRDVHMYMSAEAVADVANPDSPAPAPAPDDERGRSGQTFLVHVVVRSDGEERHAAAEGRDIYAVSAPLAVEAVERLLTGRALATGVASAGAMFEARDFLGSLSGHLKTTLDVAG
jgi:hypothetical protein